MSATVSAHTVSPNDRGGPGGRSTGALVIDRLIGEVHAHRTQWARLEVAEKITLLERVRDAIGDIGEEWVSEAARAKGFSPNAPLAVEEWLTGPWGLLFAINRYLESLRDIVAVG